MFNPVLFVCNDGVNIDIFNAFENIAFHLWVNFFHLANHIFDFLTLGSIIRVAGSASIRKLAGTLDKVQIVIITPALNFILTDEIHRADKLHSFKICRMKFWHHSLNLTAVEHTHQHGFNNIVIMMTECNFVTAKFLSLIIKVTPSHSCAKIARRFFNMEHRFKNI